MFTSRICLVCGFKLFRSFQTFLQSFVFTLKVKLLDPLLQFLFWCRISMNFNVFKPVLGCFRLLGPRTITTFPPSAWEGGDKEFLCSNDAILAAGHAADDETARGTMPVISVISYLLCIGILKLQEPRDCRDVPLKKGDQVQCFGCRYCMTSGMVAAVYKNVGAQATSNMMGLPFTNSRCSHFKCPNWHWIKQPSLEIDLLRPEVSWCSGPSFGACWLVDSTSHCKNCVSA